MENAKFNVHQNSKHLLMSCRDKDVTAWKSFEIGDGILYTEDDVKKTCPTPSSLHVGKYLAVIVTVVSQYVLIFFRSHPNIL
jgi:hypothetical protein